MIYANFLHEDDDEILDTPIKELVIDAISSGDIEDDDFGNEDGGDSDVALNESQQAEIAAVENKDFLDFTVIDSRLVFYFLKTVIDAHCCCFLRMDKLLFFLFVLRLVRSKRSGLP